MKFEMPDSVNPVLEAIQKIIQFFSQNSDNKTNDELLGIVIDIFHADSAAFAVVSSDDALTIISASGSRWQNIRRNEPIYSLSPHSLNQYWLQAMSQRSLVQYQITENEDRFVDSFCLVVPIIYHGHLLAIFDIGRNSSEFHELDLRIAKTISQYLSYVYHLKNATKTQSILRRQSQDSESIALERAKLYFSVLSHDIRNHLQTILHSTSLLRA
ncbi:MAG: hypothetical protein BAJATHORv1_30359 [Candidatus Thorarchaeota archaeon]|nr:MAG: hypothetical protein BAJATHORv1_30359 [Candidatus Thorarchaeota archaeon]